MITLELMPNTKKDFTNKYGAGTYYTGKYKGTLFGIMTSGFDAGAVVVDEAAKTITINVDVVKRPPVPRVDPITKATLVGFPTLIQKVDVENEF